MQTSSVINTHFYVSSSIPGAMFEAARKTTFKAILRLSGCENNNLYKFDLFYREALQGFNNGILMTNGVQTKNQSGNIQASPSWVAANIKGDLPNILTLGSFPRPHDFGLTTSGTLALDNEGNRTVNLSTDYVVAIQPENNQVRQSIEELNVEAYLKFFIDLEDNAYFNSGLIIWGGDETTVYEANFAKRSSIPVFIITGTGGVVDDQLSLENFSGDRVFHVHKSLPGVLRTMLRSNSLSR